MKPVSILLLLCLFGFGAVVKAQTETDKPLKILSKPRASYTDAARENNVMGQVRLEVTFQKDGKIGKIKIIQSLPSGLTESAVTAAKKIKFEPEMKNGKPVTVTEIQTYTFTIY
jgi:TonB family protein